MQQGAADPLIVESFPIESIAIDSNTALLTEVGEVMATSATPASALLDIALRCLDTQCPYSQVTAAVLMLDPDDRSWTVLASTDPALAERLPELTADIECAVAEAAQDLVSNFDRPLPIRGGRHSVVALQGNGLLLGVLLLLDCSPDRWGAIHASVTAAVAMTLGGAIIREIVQADTAAAARKSHALSRLFQEASHAGDIAEAGAVWPTWHGKRSVRTAQQCVSSMRTASSPRQGASAWVANLTMQSRRRWSARWLTSRRSGALYAPRPAQCSAMRCTRPGAPGA